MTIHDRYKIIAAAKEAGFSAIQFDAMFYDAGPYEITEPTYQTGLFYAIAFEAGRQAEREECAVEAERQGQDEPYGHSKFRCYNIAVAIRARGDTK